MKCFKCGGEMTEKHETVTDHHLGLDNVILKNVPVLRCKNCGERELVFPQIASLHRLIAKTVIRKKTHLVGQEIRYLRKYLGWSGKDLAKRLGVAPETISRWENGRLAIGAQADRLMRLLVECKDPVQHYSVEECLDSITDREPTQERMSVKMSEAGYELAGT